MFKKRLRNDSTSVLYPSSEVILDRIYCWQLWILKISSKKKATELRLIYSWITESNSDKNGWQPESVIYSRNFEIEKRQIVKMELVQFECIASGIFIQHYINGLLEGKLISEIETEVGGNISNTLLNFQLGADKAVIDGSYSVRPEVMLPLNHLLLHWKDKNLPSPTDYSVFVNQLFYFPKKDLFLFERFQLEAALIKSLIIDLTRGLQKMTGFDLSRESAPRLGNIEWFRLPVSDKNSNALISLKVINDSDMVGRKVEVRLDALPSNQHKNILINCRIINGTEITLDEVRPAVWADNVEFIEFHNSEPVSKVNVKVWERNTDTEEYIIIFEQQINCIRMINFGLSIVGTRIDTGKMNLLDKLVKSEEHRKEELAKFDRSTHVSNSVIESYEKDPWISASREIIEFMNYTLPDKSKSEFFPNGWDEDKRESGQLSFVQWILNLISGKQKSTLLFIDPYFDKDGIEIFSHARTTNTKFHLLTCTQHRERDNNGISEELNIDENSPKIEEEVSKDGLTDAARAIKDTCERSKGLFNGIDICIDDLVSKNGGKKALFHDRYLIVFDENGNLHYGFHLSNSLQGATRKEPLLVTPIPMDVLTKVNDYLSELVAPQELSSSTRDTKVVNIFRFPEQKKINAKKPNEEKGYEKLSGKLANIPNLKFLLSKVLNNPDLEFDSNDDFVNYLYSKGVFDIRDKSILMCNVNPEQWKNFATYLSTCSQDHFNSIIQSLGKCLANSQNSKKTDIGSYSSIEEIIQNISNHPEIENKLLSFIQTFKKTAGLYRMDRVYQMFIDNTFEEIGKDAKMQILHFPGDFFSIGFPYYYAIKFYVGAFPSGGFSYWQELILKARTGNWNEANPNLQSIMLLISAFCHIVLNPYGKNNIERLSLLIASNSMELRAAATASLIIAVSNEEFTKFNFEEFNNLISSQLEDPEYRISLALLITEFKLNGNKNNVTPMLESATLALSDNWSGGSVLVHSVIGILYGNIKFCNSYWIYNNFLKHLQLAGTIDQQFCFDVWNDAFLQKIAPKKTYNKGGSEDTEFYFSAISDNELTVTISEIFGELTVIQQDKILDNWIHVVDPLWKVVNRPFLQFSDYTLLSGVSTQIYWFVLLIEHMIQKNKFKEGIEDKAKELLKINSVEIKIVFDFIENRGFSQFTDLKKDLK